MMGARLRDHELNLPFVKWLGDYHVRHDLPENVYEQLWAQFRAGETPFITLQMAKDISAHASEVSP